MNERKKRNNFYEQCIYNNTVLHYESNCTYQIIILIINTILNISLLILILIFLIITKLINITKINRIVQGTLSFV